jgi:HEAT repeat protein
LHPDASFRFWAASGFGYLYSKNKPDSWPAQLNTLLDDSCMEVSAAAAEALVYAGEESAGMNALIEMCDNKNFAAASALEQLSMNHKLNEKQLDRLETIMHKDYVEYEGGFSVLSIMVNYGRLPVEDIFSKEKQAQFVSDYHMRLKRWNWFNPNQ